MLTFQPTKAGYNKFVPLNRAVLLPPVFLLLMTFTSISQDENRPVMNLKHHMTDEELKFKHLIGKDFTPTSPPAGEVRNVAEFERMQSVLIRYPFGISYSVIKEMAEDTKVITIVEDQSEENYVLGQYSSNGVNTANCEFLQAPTNSYWTRDYGPWFIFDQSDQPAIVNFPYNRPRPFDDEIPVEVANSLGIDVYGMNLTTAGGNYMTEMMGISSSSDLIWAENSSYSHAQIDQMVNDFLGINTYHVLPDPNNTYIDHIDCWGKFLDVDKVLIREVPTSHAQYDELEATAAYFASEMSSFGYPFEVYRVYTPNDQPYTNSLILNEKVLVPIMGSSWDDDAIISYQEAMPGYEIVGVTGSWESTDALHCRTKGIADIDMLYFHHIPLHGNQAVQTEYQIEAEITAHSGQPIYPDSVFIIYNVNDNDFDTILMVNSTENSYFGNIPGQSFGSEINYYLFAADQSGRSETHPFIGEPDPHVFYIGIPSFQDISINPASFDVTMLVDELRVEQMVISNLGQLVLEYSIDKQYVYTKSKAFCSSIGGGTDEYIQNVLMGSINNTSAQSNYADYTNFSTDVQVGESYPITITNGDTNWDTDQCAIWVDWNQNEDFSDENPVFVSGSPGVGPYTADIVPPLDALPGATRMRIQIRYNATPDPCASFSYGEVEDYTLNVFSNYSDWLSFDPVLGNVPGADSVTINITFNSDGLEAGDYFANLNINSNDPETPQLTVPIHMIITDARYVDLKVFLEGPFGNIEMKNDLNLGGQIPITQPFAISPWNYYGSENVPAIPNTEVIDWVLLDFRDASDILTATESTSLGRQAAFVLKDGSIVDLDGAAILPFNHSLIHSLYVVVWHRNHLGVISANPLIENSSIYYFDFTSGAGQAHGSFSQKEIVPGIWGLYSGDGNGDGTIDITDHSAIWKIEAGNAGYFSADYNLDENINNQDKNDIWKPNEGKGSQLPE